MTKRNRGSCKYCFVICVLAVMIMLGGCGRNLNQYYSGDSTELVSAEDEEIYSVSLVCPAQNKVIKSGETSPTFFWHLKKGYPDTFILDILYDGNDSVISRTIEGHYLAYVLSTEDWDFIKCTSPIVDGRQKILWRIRIMHDDDPAKEYTTGWSYFWIAVE